MVLQKYHLEARSSQSSSQRPLDFNSDVRSSERPEQSAGTATLRLVNNIKPTQSTAHPASTGTVDRFEVLRQAFARYDVDGDGLITVPDLQSAFVAQGRRDCSVEDLESWLRKRDVSKRGGVSFEDFARHYE